VVLNQKLIIKTSINVFFKIKKILFKDKPVKVRIHDGYNSFIPGFSSFLYRMAKPPKYRPFFD
jgi:hypothetical protein